MSDRPSISRPRNCSGDMNPGVPNRASLHRQTFHRLCGGKIVRRDLRESEVQHLQLTARRDDHVVRLDVTMNDAGGMRLLQRLRGLDADVHHFGRRQWVLPDPLGKTLALDVLHDDEDTIVFFADFVDGADVGMVQCGSRPGLVHQPLPRPIARLGPLGQHFDRNHAAERGVFREEDLTHPARTQLSDDSVVADL